MGIGQSEKSVDQMIGDPDNRIWERVRQFGVISLVGVVGLAIIAYGLWSMIRPEPPVVEIIKEGASKGEVIVDVAGEVEKPGIYKMPIGSRIGDALVMAGGLAAEADREWVSQFLNLAEEVKDGGKIFIPDRDENNTPNNQLTNAPIGGEVGGVQTQGKININTASQSELESLWGIGEARAKAIIASRPYATIEELVSKAKIPQSVYDKIREQISVY